MTWNLVLADAASKTLRRAPAKDQKRLLAALQAMQQDPFGGDLVRLQGIQPAAWRRRVGPWRITFDVYPDRQLVAVADIRRRTSTTY
jgi:mRNA-degrading endonuclease RelE of RelBE toxin-antitoxin system